MSVVKKKEDDETINENVNINQNIFGMRNKELEYWLRYIHGQRAVPRTFTNEYEWAANVNLI